MKQETIVGILVTILFSLSLVVGVILLKEIKRESKSPILKLQSLMKPSKVVYPENTIAVLNIFSTISYVEETTYLGIPRGGVVYWLETLKSIEDEKNVKAVILRINSPGGTVGATQELYNEILRLKSKGKVVIVSMGDIAASGAYYISCAADYILANPGTITGSIGVIIGSIEVSQLLKKLGISYNAIKSGKNKDILSPYREMSKEERELLYSVITDAYEQFLDAVSEGRKISKEQLISIADGRIFTGKQALSYKLIDEIGDFRRAVEVAKEMAKISGKENIIDLEKGKNPFYGILSLLKRNPSFSIVEKNRFSSPVLYIFTFQGE